MTVAQPPSIFELSEARLKRFNSCPHSANAITGQGFEDKYSNTICGKVIFSMGF
jgi:hypothetical protein